MKYMRTYHLPWSEGLQNDDRRMEHLDSWDENDVIVVTEKLDGENTSLHKDNIHARSEDSLHHESRNYVKQKWGQIKYLIEDDHQIVVENVYAKHSIYYDNLTDFCYLINIINKETGRILRWDEIRFWSKTLSIPLAPVLYMGKYGNWNPYMPEKSEFGAECEGYVVRKYNSFPVEDFDKHVAKFVRKGHVQTTQHWTRTWTPNKMSKM